MRGWEGVGRARCWRVEGATDGMRRDATCWDGVMLVSWNLRRVAAGLRRRWTSVTNGNSVVAGVHIWTALDHLMSVLRVPFAFRKKHQMAEGMVEVRLLRMTSVKRVDCHESSSRLHSPSGSMACKG